MRHRVVLFFLILLIQSAAAKGPAALNWYKGNLHTHTINSDGDSPPYDVMAWYKRNGYQFLAITDHNTFTDPAAFDTNPADNFLLVGGEEVTNEQTVHVNAIGITKVVPAQRGSTVTEILQASIDAIRAQGGVPLGGFAWDQNARDRQAGLVRVLPADRQKITANTLWPSLQQQFLEQRVRDGPEMAIPAAFCARGDLSVADALGRP